MTYEEAIEYIHGVSNFFCKPGLERIRELCLGLGDPQKKLKFVHVTGTNGKGSVCSMLSSVLSEAGYRVGLFTSPYVLEFNERMRVNGENISNDKLAALTEKARAVAEKMADRPTEFELITAIAFEYFYKEKCDLVILEVGMGGRYDATNIIDSSLLSIITGVSIDHTAFLGDTVEKIAYEKAGIIKPNSCALYGGDDIFAEAIIADEASKKQTILCKTNYSRLRVLSSDLSGTTFDYRSRSGLEVSLLGSYQPKNAAIVLDALDNLSGIGLHVSEDAIRRGLKKARWPARFEIIGKDPLVIFDGAHNPQGITAAVDSIKAYFGDRRVVIMSGVLRDKDYEAIADSLSEVATEVYAITPDSPRALSAEEYANVIGKRGVAATPCLSVAEALTLGKSKAKELNTALFCLGSLYTYGDVINALK